MKINFGKVSDSSGNKLTGEQTDRLITIVNELSALLEHAEIIEFWGWDDGSVILKDKKGTNFFLEMVKQ
jgi:hypothetical protein